MTRANTRVQHQTWARIISPPLDVTAGKDDGLLGGHRRYEGAGGPDGDEHGHHHGETPAPWLTLANSGTSRGGGW